MGQEKRVVFKDKTIHWKSNQYNKFVRYKARKIRDIYQERNHIIIDLGFQSYKEYLFSLLWRDIRERVLKRDSYRCKVCGVKAECVHHTKYTVANLSGRSLVDTVSLCNDCHYRIEFTPSGNRRNLDKSLRLLKADIRAGKINSHLCKMCNKLSVKGSEFCRKCKSGYNSKKNKIKRERQRKRAAKKKQVYKECPGCNMIKGGSGKVCGKCTRKNKYVRLYCVRCQKSEKQPGRELCLNCARIKNGKEHKNEIIIAKSCDKLANRLKNRTS